MVYPHCGCSTLSNKVYAGVSKLIMPLSTYCKTATAVQVFVADPTGIRLRVGSDSICGPATTPAAASFTPSAQPNENDTLKRVATWSSTGCTAADTCAAVGTGPL